MQNLPASARITSALALATLCASSFAQTPVTWKLQCQFIGNSGQMEPLADREGHAISVSDYTCRTEGGPMDGAVYTGNSVWEWDKTNAELRAGSGIYRKPGGMLVYGRDEGRLALTLADGKVTGWTDSHRGTYNVATGSAKAMAGKTWTASAHATGANQFTVDVTVD